MTNVSLPFLLRPPLLSQGGEPKARKLVFPPCANSALPACSLPQDEEPKARKLVESMVASPVLTYALGGTLKYELPTSEISLSGVFEAMSRVKQEMTVLDWGVANATLEEVFIKFARASGIKSEA